MPKQKNYITSTRRIFFTFYSRKVNTQSPLEHLSFQGRFDILLEKVFSGVAERGNIMLYGKWQSIDKTALVSGEIFLEISR